MAEGAEAGGWGEMENGLKGGGDMGEGRQRRVMGERGQGEVAGGRRLHTAAVKNTVERRFKALDNFEDTHILREGWIYFEFLTERQ